MLKFLLVVASVLALCKPGLTADLKPPPSRPHIVVDLSANRVLSAEMETVRWAPASLTKMMTAYTVFRALKLQHLAVNSPVRISEYALSQPPSKMGFPIGTILTVDAALKIIMVKSANDVSVALAESVGGSEEAFVSLMNAHARRLGMVDSHFINPHGLHDPDQYTSAYDMARLSAALIDEFPQYKSYFDIPAIRVGKRRLRNHNALVRLFEGTAGLKTGYVCASGFNVAVHTVREGRSLLAVVFGGKSGLARNVKTAKLLSDGFSDASEGIAPFVAKGTAKGFDQPVDITREICPRKYAATAKPDTRPPEAPSAQDFDGIDTQVLIARENASPTLGSNIAVPEPRPEHTPVKLVEAAASEVTANASESVSVSGDNDAPEDAAEDVPEDRPPSIRELAAIYLKPVQKLRKDVRVSLGGGTGPNPFGIRHTDGGPYRAPIPVPELRPALDLEKSEE